MSRKVVVASLTEWTHPEVLTPYLICPSSITLHLPFSVPLTCPPLSPPPVNNVLVTCTSRAGLRRRLWKRLRQWSAARSAALALRARSTYTWCRGSWWTASSTIATASGEYRSYSCCLLVFYSCWIWQHSAITGVSSRCSLILWFSYIKIIYLQRQMLHRFNLLIGLFHFAIRN